jgi:hypothetical protein
LDIFKIFKSEKGLRLLVEESKLYDKAKLKPANYKEELELAVATLSYIVSRANLIHILRLDSEEVGQDIELAILKASILCKCLDNRFYQVDVYYNIDLWLF